MLGHKALTSAAGQRHETRTQSMVARKLLKLTMHRQHEGTPHAALKRLSSLQLGVLIIEL